MQTLFLLFIGLGVLGMLVAAPLMANKIGPNPVYGFRTRKTLEDSRIWYAVNQHFGARLFVGSLFQFAAALGLYLAFPGLGVDAYALVMLGVYVLSFGVAMAQTARYMNTLK
ncbi:MAG: SdpI family protein [Chloroflexota bacterium]